ncbi:DNA replication and repair protein RecR [Desulfurobacterium pacificum]|uniref:Recombination protein RecR n=1 Tax=Desulfurobacterium pacificum TaxID=240166 RepID=A0ABY1NM76_9BACT|nr:recombination mediator RecR [Desulfurobacterium pacificum]SMP13424.1 DNA replication and repair protein RecR [Desulfurobacterium pacificum]
MIYPEALEYLIKFFSEVPGISERAAERAVLYLSKADEEKRKLVINALREVESLRRCAECGLPTTDVLCEVCKDESRDRETVCVVEQPRDAAIIEKQVGYKGLYHVLGGVISPLEDIGPEELNVNSLVRRIKEKGIKTVIIALNPTVEGEATAKFLLNKLDGLGVNVYRIAYGLPYGATMDMADELTIKKAFEDRKLLCGGK